LADGGLQTVLAACAVPIAVHGPGEDGLQTLRVCMAKNGFRVVSTRDFCGMGIKCPKRGKWCCHCHDWGSNVPMTESTRARPTAMSERRWLSSATLVLRGNPWKRVRMQWHSWVETVANQVDMRGHRSALLAEHHQLDLIKRNQQLAAVRGAARGR
jgi:hypothetical protein